MRNLITIAFTITLFVLVTSASADSNSKPPKSANKKLLETTDGKSLDGGLQWEVYASEGVGPDMQARIAAFNKK